MNAEKTAAAAQGGQAAAPSPKAPIYIYTQHAATARIIQSIIPDAVVLRQDRSRRAYEDIMAQAPSGSVVIGVLPTDDVIMLIQQGYRVILTRLDGKVVEQITGRPYNPKEDYGEDVIRKALRFAAPRLTSIRYVDAQELLRFIKERGGAAVVFNDVMRAALEALSKEMGYDVKFVKEGSGIQINPLSFSGAAVFISLPGTTGRLGVEEMAQAVKSGQARIYIIKGEIAVFDNLADALAALS
ncbi:MAG: hypothetical protein C0167_00095 [Nitrososphaera sp.]|nr:MAG: hypothetical protein C0167_00095 [Nitrososphaera sp.]